MEPNFLLIDTSTFESSVAVWNGHLKKAEIILGKEKAFAERIPTLVAGLLEQVQLDLNQLSAIVVNAGPGSYTGLRSGVSFAKGLCYGLKIPLIAVDALLVLTHKLEHDFKNKNLFLPMIDAGRMEVYAALYTAELLALKDSSPLIVDENFLQEYQDASLVFFGSGAQKCVDLFKAYPWQYVDGINHTAIDFIEPAMVFYKANKFSSIHEFEPLYLKEFVPQIKVNKDKK